MRTIALLEEPAVIRKILHHLNLCKGPSRSPPPRLFPHKLEAFLSGLAPHRRNECEPPPILSSGTTCRLSRAERPGIFSLHTVFLRSLSVPFPPPMELLNSFGCDSFRTKS